MQIDVFLGARGKVVGVAGAVGEVAVHNAEAGDRACGQPEQRLE